MSKKSQVKFAMKRNKQGGKLPQKKSKRRDPVTGNLTSQLSAHIFKKDRWVLTTPDVPNSLPQVFLSEEKAMSVANGIARNREMNVEVSHERKDENGKWLEVVE